MDIPKCKNLKESIIFLIDSAKKDGFNDREIGIMLQDFLRSSEKVGYEDILLSECMKNFGNVYNPKNIATCIETIA